jgi:hypothetical protein
MTTLGMLFMSEADKKLFHSLMGESHKLYVDFTAKGMASIPVPYAAELVTLLRTMPKQVTAPQMYGKLVAGIQCGDKLLNASTPWYAWRKSNDAKPLAVAVDSAKAMGAILVRSKSAKEAYGTGDPVYDEFLRRLTRIWIEAASLYGIQETQRTANAELKDDVKNRVVQTPSNMLWLLVTAGVSYLGIKWITGFADKPKVAVPDAYIEVDDKGSHEVADDASDDASDPEVDHSRRTRAHHED